jgi:four helix bundle protein
MLRTKTFALSVINVVEALPKNKANDVISYQLLRSSTSVGANYKEALRAESRADFIHKIGIVEKEASESEWWLELLQERKHPDTDALLWALNECRELLKIFCATGRSAKRRR